MGAEWLMTPTERLLLKSVRHENGCLLWTGWKDVSGYGHMGYGHRRSITVHRVAYLEWVGEIPEGLTIDHLCHTTAADLGQCEGGIECIHRACIEPTHLEPVTHAENTRRGLSFTTEHSLKTHCPQGHPYDEVNTYLYQGRRYCKECNRKYGRERQRRYRAERKARALRGES